MKAAENKSLMIGFTEKFFTLWSHRTEEIYQTVNDQHYLARIEHRYTYLQNLSMTEAEAIKKAQSLGCVNLEVCEWLKGQKGSFMRSESFDRPSFNDNQFAFGKYEGLLITESDDAKYLSWYAKESGSSVAAERLCVIDSNFIMVEGSLMSKKDKLLNDLLEDESLTWIAKSNFGHLCENTATVKAGFEPRTEEEFELLNDFPYGIRIELNVSNLDLKTKYYNGFEYWTPSGMRSFKGKEFTMSKNQIIIK